jgi:hypothetical protein
MAAVVAVALLLPASGSAVAAGGTSIGTDEYRAGRPAYAGKMGGVTGGIDRSAYATSAGDEASEDVDRPITQGGKVGGGMDRPTTQGGKNGIEPVKS